MSHIKPLQKLTFFSFLVLLACAAPQIAISADASDLARLPRVVYGFDREFPPFSYEEAGGKPVGFEIELLSAALNGKANLIMRPLNWDKVPLELSSGAIHVTSGVIGTEQRRRNFGLSALPTLPLQIRFFSKIYNRVPSAALLRGQPVSVDEGSYQQQVLEAFGGVNIKPYPPKTAGVRALYNDEVAAYCGLDKTTYYYINKLNYGPITTVGAPIGTVNMHFAVNRDRGDILRLVNDGMKEVVASGEYDRIYRRWFVRELSEEEKDVMIKAAREATITAYAPYSKNTMGAAVLTATGKVFTSCNVENADPAQSLSAARAAAARAIAAGEMEIRAFVTVNQNGDIIAPTRQDAQFIYEFGRHILALVKTPEGAFETPMLANILPNPVVAKTSTPAYAE